MNLEFLVTLLVTQTLCDWNKTILVSNFEREQTKFLNKILDLLTQQDFNIPTGDMGGRGPQILNTMMLTCFSRQVSPQLAQVCLLSAPAGAESHRNVVGQGWAAVCLVSGHITVQKLNIYRKFPQLTGTNQERADASSSLWSWTSGRAAGLITNINLIN